MQLVKFDLVFVTTTGTTFFSFSTKTTTKATKTWLIFLFLLVVDSLLSAYADDAVLTTFRNYCAELEGELFEILQIQQSSLHRFGAPQGSVMTLRRFCMGQNKKLDTFPSCKRK